MVEKKFEIILRESVNEELEKALGEQARRVILRHIESKQMVGEDKIGERPEIFEEGLDGFFREGSLLIKQSIIRNLYSKLGLEYKAEDFDFLEEIERAKRTSKPSEG